MSIRQTLAIVLYAIGASACASAPLRCPSADQWNKRSIWKNDQKSIDVQGAFHNDPKEFGEAALKLKDGMTKETVMGLGFTTETSVSHPCDAVGWIEASQLILGSSIIPESSIQTAMDSKRQYSAIRCHANWRQLRTDRELAYVNNFDTCSRGVDTQLTIIFRKNDKTGIDEVAGIDLNRTPIKTADRQSSFLRVFGNMISPPKLDPSQLIKVP
ncbi:hypothetical protein KGO95_01750 [Patescibacteria group bacterium]|nr:hypothetical protein [Patescibacteria group bacterium]